MSKYKVGKNKPPKEHQFQPGQSGNPKGRPKKPKAVSMAEVLRIALAEKVPATINGRAVKLTRLDALVRLQLEKALAGNDRATDRVLRLAALIPPEADTSQEQSILDLQSENEMLEVLCEIYGGDIAALAKAGAQEDEIG